MWPVKASSEFLQVIIFFVYSLRVKGKWADTALGNPLPNYAVLKASGRNDLSRSNCRCKNTAIPQRNQCRPGPELGCGKDRSSLFVVLSLKPD